MDPETTMPPRQPNTPRVWLKRAWLWLKSHPEYAVPLAAFGLGWLVGKVL